MRKAIILTLSLVVLGLGCFLWSNYLRADVYSGRELLWVEPEYSEFRQLLANGRISVVHNSVNHAGSLAIVDFEVKVPRQMEFPYGSRQYPTNDWLITIFFGILFACVITSSIMGDPRSKQVQPAQTFRQDVESSEPLVLTDVEPERFSTAADL